MANRLLVVVAAEQHLPARRTEAAGVGVRKELAVRLEPVALEDPPVGGAGQRLRPLSPAAAERRLAVQIEGHGKPRALAAAQRIPDPGIAATEEPADGSGSGAPQPAPPARSVHYGSAWCRRA